MGPGLVSNMDTCMCNIHSTADSHPHFELWRTLAMLNSAWKRKMFKRSAWSIPVYDPATERGHWVRSF